MLYCVWYINPVILNIHLIICFHCYLLGDIRDIREKRMKSEFSCMSLSFFTYVALMLSIFHQFQNLSCLSVLTDGATRHQMHGCGSTPIACHTPSNGNVSVTLLSVLSLSVPYLFLSSFLSYNFWSTTESLWHNLFLSIWCTAT